MKKEKNSRIRNILNKRLKEGKSIIILSIMMILVLMVVCGVAIIQNSITDNGIQK